MEISVHDLVNMYDEVLSREYESLEWCEIMLSLAELRRAYKRINSQLPISIIDYNIGRHRFAYIYLYAVCHTIAVQEHVRILETNRIHMFQDIMKFNKSLRLCCLGGGPGCDMIGVLNGINYSWSSSVSNVPSRVDCTVLDMCYGWNISLSHVLDRFLDSEFGRNYKPRISFNFVQTDLCSNLGPLAKCAIENADLLTMVKFVSVVSYYYRNNLCYLENVFSLMKSGSFLFFLDNSSGGFYEMVAEEAHKNGLILIFVHKSLLKIKEHFKFYKYEIPDDSLKTTSVIVAVWMKS